MMKGVSVCEREKEWDTELLSKRHRSKIAERNAARLVAQVQRENFVVKSRCKTFPNTLYEGQSSRVILKH